MKIIQYSFCSCTICKCNRNTIKANASRVQRTNYTRLL